MSKPSVLIVGGGAFGTSTAFHLNKRGYSSVTVLDRFDAPSTDSAATDLNKVIRFDYPNPLYSALGREAYDAWTSPCSLFAGLYRKTGWIMSGHEISVDWLKKAFSQAKEEKRQDVYWLSTEDIKSRWTAFSGQFPGWTNLFSGNAGWVPSGEALLRMAREAEKNGVKYVCGRSGTAVRLIYDDTNGTCTGVLTADGSTHTADLVILANGAQIPMLIEARDEVEASGSAVAVIELTPEEAEKYKDIPIIDDFDQAVGFSDRPHDGIPDEIDKELRDFLHDMAPDLANKPWVTTRMCWDGVSKDINFRICPHPNAKNLYVATVGSLHGFKFLPIIGKYVADMLEGKLSPGYTELWSWKMGEETSTRGCEVAMGLE
ncbi:putative fructosyl amino acid oxidase [Diaporthe ampelina]|uniref:Putative fructosyl amino acid oxidase n=1 Tax=Diaporthe ampelina TaxID=1214573 RepID=A0A0G2F8X9_9PEZI|nr:putative fructosyl amino acid oxidase [Diaporthe ampelina]